MKLFYISQGNIPTKWAHSMQAMKMAEAFAKLVPNFRLITQAPWFSFLQPRFDYETWYGIRHPFRIVRLPTLRSAYWQSRNSVWDMRFDAAAARYTAAKRPDLILTRSPNAGRLCVQEGISTIIERHAPPEEHQFPHIQSIKDAESFLGIVTTTDDHKTAYIEAGIPEEKIFVESNAVDINAFSGFPDKNSLRESLDLSNNRFLATYSGHLYQDRGVEDILQCAVRLKEVQFLHVGGWEEDVARRELEAQHLNNVLFTGFVPNSRIPKYLAASDVLLMPYSRGCKVVPWMCPLKLFEYMASRRPIIATDLPAIRKHLQDGRNARLIPPDSPGALTEAIAWIRDNPNEASRMAGAAFEDVRSCTWTNRAKAILARFAPDGISDVSKGS
ncbi:MAG: glycosyltransferase [Deltaproteobacteria bacterium]|nr:glycosyltransferase [Deltaproteobacteria bacterium]